MGVVGRSNIDVSRHPSYGNEAADHQRPEALADANRGVQQSGEVWVWIFRSLGTGGDLRCHVTSSMRWDMRWLVMLFA